MLGRFDKCCESNQIISLFTLWWDFLCSSVAHGDCQTWRQQWFIFGWVLAGLGVGDSLFPSCKYRFPFGLFCSSKGNIDSSTGQAGLCTGSSTFALLLVQLMAIPWINRSKRDSVALVALLLFIQAGSSHEIFCKVMPGGAADMCFAGKLLCRSAWGQIFVRAPKNGLSCRTRSHLVLYHSTRSNLRSVRDVESRSPKTEKNIIGEWARVE